jgi:hypothetical protein
MTSTLRPNAGSWRRRVGNGQDGEVALRERQPPRLAVDHVDAQRGKEPEDAHRLGRTRGVVVARHHDDNGIGERADQPRELNVRLENGLVGGAHIVEHVARDQHQVRLDLDDLVDRRPEYRRDISLPLVDPGGGLPLELAVAEVEVGEVDEAHRRGRGFARYEGNIRPRRDVGCGMWDVRQTATPGSRPI